MAGGNVAAVNPRSFDQRTVMGWDAAAVARYIREDLQLPLAADLCLSNDVDGATFLDLTAEDLKSMGVTQLGHWKKILRYCGEIKSKTKVMSANLIPSSHLTLVSKIGGGNFGQVWKAKWNDLTDVAVKWLSESAHEDFLAEIQVLQKVRHPHVIETFGCSIDEENRLQLVTELLDTSLLGYLRDHMRHEMVDLLAISLQVNKAMVHLSKHGVVHRDLAARNVLLKLGGMVPLAKVCDFGLGKMTESDGYYVVSSPGVPLPLKWTAPEAMEKKQFGEKSDVWSFGVLLWEIFSWGAEPYLGWDSKLILKQLKEGERLERSDKCPEHLYALMVQCWHMDSRQRPTFVQLHDRLSTHDEDNTRMHLSNQYIDVNDYLGGDGE